MQVPLELTFRHMDSSPSLASLIREQTQKLERFCDHINSCHVAVELDHASSGRGDEFRVRVDVRVAGGHEVVSVETADHKEVVHAAVRAAFDHVGRQLKKLSRAQRADVKRHPEQDLAGVITKLFQDYGFISTADGREVYFHERSVLSVNFNELKLGMGVAYTEEDGDEGPQASSVRVVDGRGGLRGSESLPDELQ